MFVNWDTVESDVLGTVGLREAQSFGGGPETYLTSLGKNGGW